MKAARRRRPGGATAPEVRNVLDGSRFHCHDEDQLQAGLAEALAAAGHTVHREVRLCGRDRMDLLVGRTGIEVKVAGQPESVLRQLTRYAQSDRVDELVLVTTRARHRALPDVVGGKPLTVVQVGGAA